MPEYLPERRTIHKNRLRANHPVKSMMGVRSAEPATLHATPGQRRNSGGHSVRIDGYNSYRKTFYLLKEEIGIFRPETDRQSVPGILKKMENLLKILIGENG